jgi:hypothetical protein
MGIRSEKCIVVQFRHCVNITECLMFVLCIARLSINNQHYALDYITSLFNMQAPTCFSSRVTSSGSFLDPCELLEKQNSDVVCHTM